MKNKHNLSLVATTVACIVSVCSACSTGHAAKPQASSNTSSEQPRPVRDLEFHSAKEALNSDSEANDAAGCPAFPEESRSKAFGDDFTFRHDTWKTPSSAALACNLWRKGNRRAAGSSVFLSITRNQPSNRQQAISGNLLFYNHEPLLRNGEFPWIRDFPGYGLGTENNLFRWHCGPYRIKIFSNMHRHASERIHSFDLIQALKFHVQDLCGTADSPSEEVMSDPYTAWAVHDAFGGLSPSSYGLERPADLPSRPQQQGRGQSSEPKPSSSSSSRIPSSGSVNK